MYLEPVFFGTGIEIILKSVSLDVEKLKFFLLKTIHLFMQRASQNSNNIYVFFLTWQRRQRICTIGIFKRKITNYYTQNFTRRINERSYRLSKPVPCFSPNPFFIRIHIYYPGLSTPSTRFPFPRSASLTTTVGGSKCRWRVWREKKKKEVGIRL